MSNSHISIVKFNTRNSSLYRARINTEQVIYTLETEILIANSFEEKKTKLCNYIFTQRPFFVFSEL